MPRRKKQDNAGGGEIDPNAWMTTFADLLMLLLTFFVLLLTMKSMEGENLKDVVRHVSSSVGPLDYPRSKMIALEDMVVKPVVVKNEIVHDQRQDQAEKQEETDREKETAPGRLPKTPQAVGPLDYANSRVSVLEQLSIKPVVIKQEAAVQERLNKVMEASEVLAGRSGMAAGARDRIRIFQDNRGVVVSLGVDNLFKSGGAGIKADRLYLLDIIGKLLATTSNDILVMGHTDSQPLNTAQYSSNWELSVYRALTVVYYLTDSVGLDKNKLAAGGYGASLPYLPNTTPENRAKNRRVEFILKVPKPAF
ncbi:MAG: flagellar motor protein MotB [Thermodesulfobacteriota bacterium]|nr:flagellar motor protein MotB [Thermodesulfobacteriota bacterium]